MSSERWQNLKKVFTAAIDLKEAQRETYLQEVCSDDADLLESVRELIAAHLSPGPLDDLQKQLGRSSLVDAQEDSEEGRRIGAYEILRQIGDGGMSRIFLARRSDGQFDQTVALKLLRTDIVTASQADRFLAERQILAGLNHPNIARLHDGGITENGHPYFVMEYVEGEAIDQYCNRHRLSIRQRVELFLDVCEAVNAAHRALIIHRDIKPSNVLVTKSGTVKLVDFGIAKLLEPTSPDWAVRTQTGLIPMTPGYAAPEQIRGQTITTATDVYQLGLTLYELLSGMRATAVSGNSAVEVERAICDVEPERPSEAVARNSDLASQISGARSARHDVLSSQLHGDLDTIVMKALRKEPHLRYQSAEQLQADLRRHLERRPIHARRQTWRYRTSRFVRRHSWGVATGAVMAVLLLVYVMTITWQSQQTQAALAEAERQALRSDQVTTFLMDLFEASDPAAARGDTVSARTLLDRGVERVQALADQPVIQGQMLDVVGQIYARLGHHGRAESLLEESLRLRVATEGESSPAATETAIHLAAVLQQGGRYEESIPLLNDALASLQHQLGENHPEVALTMASLGAALRVHGELNESEQLLQNAMTIQREQDDRNGLGETLNLLGLVLGDRDQSDEAEAMMRESIDIRRETLGDPHPQLAKSLNNLAMLLRKKGDLQGAEPLYREAIDMKWRLYGEAHPSIAASIDGLGLLLRDRGDFEEAEVHLRQALEMRRDLLGDDHPLVAGSLNNVGNVLESQGELELAEELMRRARSSFQTVLGREHLYVAYPSLGIARVLMKQDRPHEAETFAREALEIRRSTFSSDHPDVVEAISMLSESLIVQEQYAEAEALLQASVEQLPEGGELWRQTLYQLVALYEMWQKPESAQLYVEVLSGPDD